MRRNLQLTSEETEAVERIGRRVRLARLRRNISQAEMAERIGVSRKDLCRPRSGRGDREPRGARQGAFPEQSFGIGEYLAVRGDDGAGDLQFGPSADAPPSQWRPPRRPSPRRPRPPEIAA
jgi:DNA-binding XRE family transcriptional regulator